jgi:hypothetical protein
MLLCYCSRSLDCSQLISKLDGQGVLAADSVTGQPAASGQPAAPPIPADTAATSATHKEMLAASADTTAGSTEQAALSAAPLVVVLYGPPLAGTSTQASLLSNRYSLPVTTLDVLLHEAYRLQQEQAAEAAAAAAAADAPPSPDSSQKRQLLDQLSKLLFAPPEQTLHPASPTGRVQSASKTRGASAGGYADSHQHLSAPEVVAAALQMALQQEQYTQGYIVDGLNSKHLSSPAVAARCLMMAVGLTCKALQQPEVPTPPASASAAKGVKAPSRPPSSRPGAKSVAVPEPAPPILTFAGPDAWEGNQQVSHCLGVTAKDDCQHCFHEGRCKFAAP